MWVPPIQPTAEATDTSQCRRRAANTHEHNGTMMLEGMSGGIGSRKAEKFTREWVERSVE